MLCPGSIICELHIEDQGEDHCDYMLSTTLDENRYDGATSCVAALSLTLLCTGIYDNCWLSHKQVCTHMQTCIMYVLTEVHVASKQFNCVERPVPGYAYTHACMQTHAHTNKHTTIHRCTHKFMSMLVHVFAMFVGQVVGVAL